MPGLGDRRRRLAHLHATARSAPSAPASARPTSPPASRSASSGRRSRGRSGSSSRARSGRFVTGKDLILAVHRRRSASAAATNCVLEFVGDGAAALSVDERLAVCEHGGRGGRGDGPVPRRRDDRRVPRRARAEPAVDGERSDPDAELAADAARSTSRRCEPLVALPHLPGNVVPIARSAGTKIDQVYIGNCSNGTMTDLRQAAEMLRGNRVHPDCRMIVVPATQRDLPGGAARGAARRLRRGRRDGLDADLRRLLRRPHGRARPPASAR